MIWETERPGRRNTGPNDARRVVWALGEFFFFSFVLLDNYQSFVEYLGYKLRYTKQGDQ